MIRVENLIVEGKCFFPIKIDIKSIYGLKNTITRFMTKKYFQPDDIMTIFEEDKHLSMSFTSPLRGDIPFYLKILRHLNLVSEESVKLRKYFYGLRNTRDELPFTVKFSIVPGKAFERRGFIIIIRSEPVILQKICQLFFDPNKIFLRSEWEFAYSKIIDRNIQFVEEIIFGLGARILENPKAKIEYKFEPKKTPIIEEMEKSGINDVAELLKKSRIKIERGDIEDGLTDLRASLEIFSRYLVEKIKMKTKGSIRANLNILVEEGYFDQKIILMVTTILESWLHKAVHVREKIKSSEAKLLFSIIENIHYFLLRKVVYRE